METDEKKKAIQKFIELLPQYEGFDQLLLEAYAVAKGVPFFPEWVNELPNEDKFNYCQELYQIIKDSFEVVDLDDNMTLEEKALIVVRQAQIELSESLDAATPEEALDHVKAAIGFINHVVRRSDG